MSDKDVAVAMQDLGRWVMREKIAKSLHNLLCDNFDGSVGLPSYDDQTKEETEEDRDLADEYFGWLINIEVTPKRNEDQWTPGGK